MRRRQRAICGVENNVLLAAPTATPRRGFAPYNSGYGTFMSERTRRVAENEVTFRRANEHLRADFSGYPIATDELVPFLCECGDRRCTKIVRLSLDEYEAVRDDPNAFFIVPGHNDRETEQVVDDADHDGAMEDTDRFAVVRKRESVRDITERNAPRRA